MSDLDFTFTLTLELWWLVAYLGVGVLTFLPADYIAWRYLAGRPGYSLRGRKPLNCLIQIVVWPLALWEVLR